MRGIHIAKALVGLTIAASPVLIAGGVIPQPSLGPCASTALSSLIGFRCTEGVFTLGNFGFSVINPMGGIVPLTASQITATPFAGAFGLGFFAPFNAVNGQSVTYEIDYTIDPPPPIIRTMQLDLFADTPVAPGTADITENVCAGRLFEGKVCQGMPATLTVFHHGSAGSFLASQVNIPDTNLVDIRLFIALDSHGTGSAAITGVGTLALAVPEPRAWALGFAGLAVLALRRRRRH